MFLFSRLENAGQEEQKKRITGMGAFLRVQGIYISHDITSKTVDDKSFRVYTDIRNSNRWEIANVYNPLIKKMPCENSLRVARLVLLGNFKGLMDIAGFLV